MADTTQRPVIFLAFANDRDDSICYLRNLPIETRRLREVLEPAEQAGLCEVVVRTDCTASDIFKVFQDPRYRNRVAIFHYGGHANGYQLLLESAAGQSVAADAGGLAEFFGQQQGLHLVFLNGCSTQQQTEGLLDANVSVVIATSRAIDDTVATNFAHQFYQGLAGGATIHTAFYEAESAIRTDVGGNMRSVYRTFGARGPTDVRCESADQWMTIRSAYHEIEVEPQSENSDASRGLFFGSPINSAHRLEADRWPWNLSLRKGSEAADQWNLPEAVNDPLFGLPPLPELDLPESPYRHLNWFTHKEAEVFFGRGHQIRDLYDRLTASGTAPIVLFYGQSGVGKSSVLDAGLIPRLQLHYEVHYLRRGPGGLLETLQEAFIPGVQIESAWREKEQQTHKPLIVFLDQVEELYTRPLADVPDELNQLLKVVKAVFCDASHRPQGKLVLGFRKEWLAELESQLIAHELPRTKVFLEPLDRRGIVEVVRGPVRSVRLRERYGLSVEADLAEIIADDLLEDQGSAIAPTLQILLTKLWAKATETNYEHPLFSQNLYQQLKRDGILLRDFLNQQIAVFRQRYPEAVDSGLLLDILAFHTTPLGTANQRGIEELQQQYSHVEPVLLAILNQCEDLHLLTVTVSPQIATAKTTRLVHDTLAPIVREQFDQSDKPGQRARRILDVKFADRAPRDSRPEGLATAKSQPGSLLDDIDLKMVEDGAVGTRQWNEFERRLVDASRQARAVRKRWIKAGRYFAVAATVLIAVSAGFASWQWRIAADGRKNYLEQKNWGNNRVDYYQRNLRSIQRQVRSLAEEAGPQKDFTRVMAAIQSIVNEGLHDMVLPDGTKIQVVRVSFVTTRSMEETGEYGYRPNTKGPEFGYCDVTIPLIHRIGMLESPALGNVESPAHHVAPQTVQRSTNEDFRNQLESWSEGNTSRVLVFVHSWNTSFNDAVRRVAQIAHDIQFNGEVVLFSWCSRSSTTGYVEDVHQLDASSRAFDEMLDALSKVYADKDINLLGHGLGAQLVAKGCANWLEAATGRHLGEIVLLAADIDEDVFRQMLAPQLTRGARNVTSYVSANDTALQTVKQFSGHRRIGAEAVEFPGIDTIELADPDPGIMLRDLYQLLKGAPASERPLLRSGGHFILK